MTILRATVVRERGSERSTGKSHKDPLVNLIKSDENQRPRLRDARDSRRRKREKEVVSSLKALKRAEHNGANIVLLLESFKVEESIEKTESGFSFPSRV